LISPTNSISVSFQLPVEYEVLFTRELFSEQNPTLNEWLNRQGTVPKVAVLCERIIIEKHPHLEKQISAWLKQKSVHGKEFWSHLEFFEGGENVKNDSTSVDKAIEKINEWGMCRHSVIIAMGGGAFLDAIGYATSIAHRGIRLLRCPSTVLAQNDAGIGVKNGINAFGKKNFLGTFNPPCGVINDSSLLSSLDDRSAVAGYAEALKVALLKDPIFFDWIEENAGSLKNRKTKEVEYLIYRCAQLHLKHISENGDPFEKGSSRPLDFGHWSAHKIEQLTNFDCQHGEAVALGIQLDCLYAHSHGWMNDITLKRIQKTIEQLGLPIRHPVLENFKLIWKGMSEFQEHLGGSLAIPIIKEPGVSFEVHEVDSEVYSGCAKKLV
jgi:3-dehydroquinate synthase